MNFLLSCRYLVVFCGWSVVGAYLYSATTPSYLLRQYRRDDARRSSTVTARRTTQLSLSTTESKWDFIYQSKYFQILSKDKEGHDLPNNKDHKTIVLQDLSSAWGNGAHPTTKLCIDFLENTISSSSNNVEPTIFLDYGTGSGILSIIAAKLGAKKCIAVDIDEDTLTAARYNAQYNNVQDAIDVIHTKSVYIGDNSLPLADVTVANILPGPLSRLVAPLWLLTKPMESYACLE